MALTDVFRLRLCLGRKTMPDSSWSMVTSYAFYILVILFAAATPALGLLMIPKAIANVVMGIIAYKGF